MFQCLSGIGQEGPVRSMSNGEIERAGTRYSGSDLERLDKAWRHFVFRVGNGARVDEPNARRVSDERGQLKGAGFTQWRQDKFGFDERHSNDGMQNLNKFNKGRGVFWQPFVRGFVRCDVYKFEPEGGT